LKVSQLGFGAMRLPMAGDRVNRDLAIPMIHRAFEAGVNYIDTATMYCNNDSQCAVGEALVGWRDRIVVSTKNPYFGEDEKEWWTNLENSLQRLRVDSIDIYNYHGINWDNYTRNIAPRVSRWMQRAKDQGLIKHICTSFHDDNAALRRIVDTGAVAAITLQYNLLDRRLEDGIAYAHEQGIGVIVMGPVAGGRLGADSAAFASVKHIAARVPELALRFVLSNPHVTVALSGMSTMQQVEENLAIASDPVALRPGDDVAIREHLVRLEKLTDLYCTGCRYCLPCPHGVNIPGIFDWFNKGRIYGTWEYERQRYRQCLRNQHGADQCVECGDCEPKCPQHIPIRQRLREAHAALT